MVKFICLFLPAVLSVWLYEHLNKTGLKGRKWGYFYAMDLIVINGLCFAAKRYLLHTATYPLTDGTSDMIPSAALNYLIMSIPLAVITALVQVFCFRHTALSIEDAADEN